MRRIEPSTKFRRDFRREGKGRYRNLLVVGGAFYKITDMLAKDIQLPLRYRDHALHGNWEGCRERHVRPDLLLIYRYGGTDLLILERLGSHAEIFGL